MIVKCIHECFDSKRARRYYPGDQDNIDPKEPVAKYFEGFPPGTEVYFKEPGSKTKPIKEGFRVIPGKVEEKPKEEKQEEKAAAAKVVGTQSFKK